MIEFVEAQQRMIQEMIKQTIVSLATTSSFDSLSLSDLSNQNAAENEYQSRWNLANLDFFDLMYDDKFVSTEETMKHIEKNTYFRDVHFFIERVKNLVTIKDIELIRENLWTCLRDTALAWWTDELSENEKRMTKLTFDAIDDRLEEWTRLLHDRFKELFNIALDAMTKKKYTLRDVVNRRESREYAQKIVRFAKNVELTTLQNQFDTIYNNIDSILRKRNVKRLKIEAKTTLSSMMKNLNDAKHDWWNYDAKTFRSQSFNRSAQAQRVETRDQYSNSRQAQSQSNFQRQNQFYQFYSNNRSNVYQNSQYQIYDSFNRSYQDYQFEYQFQQQIYQDQFSSASVLTSSQRLQITTDSQVNALSSSNDNRANNQSRQSFQARSNQFYRFNRDDDYQSRAQRAYQASVKKEQNVANTLRDENDEKKSSFYHHDYDDDSDSTRE